MSRNQIDSIPALLLVPDADKLPPRVAGAIGALFAAIAGASYRVDVSTFMWIVTDNVPPQAEKDVYMRLGGVAFLQLDRDARIPASADATIAFVDVEGARTTIVIKPSDLEVLRAYGDKGFSEGGQS